MAVLKQHPFFGMTPNLPIGAVKYYRSSAEYRACADNVHYTAKIFTPFNRPKNRNYFLKYSLLQLNSNNISVICTFKYLSIHYKGLTFCCFVGAIFFLKIWTELCYKILRIDHKKKNAMNLWNQRKRKKN